MSFIPHMYTFSLNSLRREWECLQISMNDSGRLVYYYREQQIVGSGQEEQAPASIYSQDRQIVDTQTPRKKSGKM